MNIHHTITAAIITTAQDDGQRVLLLKRNTTPFLDYWEMVGGHVEAEEMPIETVVREVMEETGIVIEHVRCLLLEISHFTWNGQPAQNWLYRVEVPAPLQVLLSDEHVAAEWKLVREALTMDLAFKHTQHLREVLEAK